MAEVCRAAGVPKGSFYYFFESKEALALAVVDEHWAAQKRDWTRVLAGDGEPLRRLRRLFEETEAGRLADGVVLGYLAVEFSFRDRSPLDVKLSVVVTRVAQDWYLGHYQVSRLE